MKKIVAGILAGALAVGALAGCGASKTSSAADDKVIRVGASPTPHAEILNAAKDILAEKGYTLEVVEFTDYIQPNVALNDGQLDANYFQHGPYLDNYNVENGTDLANAGVIHYEPFGIYPGKTATVEELQDGAVVTVPNDDTNETRALLLLQEQGLIKLKDGIDATKSATIVDIVENPKNLKIQEIEAAQLARSLQDADVAVINGNFAIQAGLSVKNDAIVTESAESEASQTYANVIAVRAGEEESAKTKALLEALTSDTVRDFINNTYDGAVVPIF